MARPLRALVVEDCDDDALLVAAALGRGGYDLTYSRIQTAAEMRGALESGAWDIVLCDHNLPQFDAPSALRLLRSMDADLPFIIISGTIGEDVAVEALKQGADDYLLKQNLKRLIPAVERSLEDAGNRRRRRAAEKANALIMAHSAEVICTVGSDFRLLEVSAAARTVWGYEPEELKGAQLLNLVHPDDFERTREAARQTLAGKPVREFENRNICKDGSVVYMTWSTYWSAAEALGFCIGRDVTERQRAAEALQASEGRLRSYIENAPMAIAILDAEGRYVSANRSALDLVGWDSGMLAARSFRDLFSEEDLPAAVRDFQTLLVQGHMDGEYRLARQDGGVVWVLLRAVRAGDGRYMAFCTDVTGRKETERLLRQEQKAGELPGGLHHQALAALVVGTVLGLVSQASFQGESFELEAALGEAKALFESHLGRGAKRAGRPRPAGDTPPRPAVKPRSR
ncbi:MAG: PAS domain S-box protein [Acidobacteria bacterium]|nr:PAS domain S-box protein [Acidobacteriota bacterium]